tara:strand:+ start:97 stop:336 length:240 start_codon:yes stop_codon:yes gene_type:complete
MLSNSNSNLYMTKATYTEIQNYVQKKHGRVVKTCWIAHAKEICGLKPRRSHRRQGKRVYPCPDEKLPWIKEAFRHYKMI